jgi:hypothetical protein
MPIARYISNMDMRYSFLSSSSVYYSTAAVVIVPIVTFDALCLNL